MTFYGKPILPPEVAENRNEAAKLLPRFKAAIDAAKDPELLSWTQKVLDCYMENECHLGRPKNRRTRGKRKTNP